MTTDITQHTCASWCLVPGHALQALCCILLIFVTRRGWLESERGAGRGNTGFDSLRERDQRDRGPVMQIHQLFIYHLYTSSFFNCKTFWDNFSIGGRLCPVRIIIGGSPSASHVWSSELGVTTEFPSSCNNFTWPADTDRQSQPAHNWTHENTGCFVKCGQEDPDMDIIIWRQNSIHGDSQPVKLDPRDVLNGRETDERV